MKNRFFLFLASLLFIGVSCTPEETPEAPVAPSLEVFPGAVSFTFQGGTKTLTVDCSVEGWTVESDQAWLEAVKTNETTVTLTAGELKEGDATPEAAVVTVTAGEGDAQTTKEIPVSQKPFVAELVFDAEFANTSYNTTDFTVTPSDEEAPYCVVLLNAMTYGDMSAAELLALVEQNADVLALNDDVQTGTQTFNYQELFPGCGFVAIVFGWEDNASTSEGFLFNVTTEATSQDFNETEIFITASNVTGRAADLAIEISDPNQLYLVMSVEMADIETITKEYAQAVVDQNKAKFFSGVVCYGNTEIAATGLNPLTDYAVCIIPVDGEGTVTNDPYIEEAVFTTEEVILADGFESWLGTWDVTSTSSEASGDPLTIQVVFTEGQEANQLAVFGWDLCGARYQVPLIAMYDAELDAITVDSELYFGPIQLGDGKEYDLYYSARAWLGGSYNAYYFISGEYTALTGTMDADKENAEISGEVGQVGDGTEFTVSNCIMNVQDADEKIYLLQLDETLGFDESEILVGPFTMEKVSDDTTVPGAAGAPAYSYGNVFANMNTTVNAPYAKVAPKFNVNNAKLATSRVSQFSL